MKRIQTILLATAVALALAACSDPKAATKDNFQKAINVMVEKQPECLYFTNGKLPIKVGLMPGKAAWAVKDNEERLKKPEAFVKLGFLKAGETATDESGVLWKKYDLTEEGKKHFNSVNGLMGSVGGFCYAQRSVTSLGEITEPATRPDGVTVSQAAFKFTVGKLDKWVTETEIQTLFKGKIAKEGDTFDGKVMLEKTLDGWVAK